MNRVLKKRIWRDLKQGFWRYLALLLLIVLGMYLVTAVVGAAEAVITGTAEKARENQVEDGQFCLFLPLTVGQEQEIQDMGVTLERMFSIDVEAEDGSVLRVMENRRQINRIALDTGRLAEKPGEAVLEKRYCEEHSLHVGDEFSLGGYPFKVVGIGSVPDYDTPFQKYSDVAVESSRFGLAFVTEEQYTQLEEAGQAAQEYCYAYRLNGQITARELKEWLKDLDFDYHKIKDPYFHEMIADVEETRDDISQGVGELLDGSRELSEGLLELSEHNGEIQDGADALFDAMLDEANQKLSDAGIKETLRKEDYKEQLERIAASPESYSREMKEAVLQAKAQLEELETFREGVRDYRDGVQAARDGSAQLSEGLSALAQNNPALTEAADTLFRAALLEADQEVKALQAGLSGENPSEDPFLTEEGFESQIAALVQSIPDTQQVAEQMKAALNEAKEQLVSLKAFRDGIYGYTEGVDAAAGGGRELSGGMGQLTDASPALVEASDAIFDAMLESVEEQLGENGLKVELTRENFRERLDALAAPGGQVNALLRENLETAQETLSELMEFRNGLLDYTDAVGEAADGSRELLDGVQELKDETDEMLDEYFKIEVDNLTSFIQAEENPRIAGAAGDQIMNKEVGLAAGVIIMILFAYVISVFVVHQIQQESSVIGTLYALGAKKRELLCHYLVLPVALSFVGGSLGLALGLSDLGVRRQLQDVYSYFSIPDLQVVYPVYLLLYGIVMPPATALLVNYLVINRRLSRTALSLMRGERREGPLRKINLGRMPFLWRFQVRQMLRELRTEAAVIFGMIISLLVFMLGMNCAVLCVHVQDQNAADTAYEYLYMLKYPKEDVPEGAAAAYSESLSRTYMGYTLDVTVMGIEKGNPYFPVTPVKGKSKVVASSAAAQKYGLSLGDSLVLTDSAREMDYAFTVAGIADYSVGLTVFMDIDSMRELFEREEDYYNVLLSEKELPIEEGRLYAVTSRGDVERSAGVFIQMMIPMVTMMCGVSSLIFAIVLYLMMKVMTDRAAFGISLMGIFGYRTGEIRRLYLDGNFFVVAAGAFIGVPVSKMLMDLAYPRMIANIACGMDLSFPLWLYAGIIAGILAIYLVINQLLAFRVKRISPAEVLKERE